MRRQQRRDLGDRALLPAGRAIAVVKQQDAHVEAPILPTSRASMAIALLTNYLTGLPRPAVRAARGARTSVEVLCFGGGERYVPAVVRADLDAPARAAPFPARRLDGARARRSPSRARYDAVIAPYRRRRDPAGRLPRRAAPAGRPFVLWASVWAQPRSLTHALALPVTRHIYRHADAVVAYGEHVRRFVAWIRGRDDDVFVAPQSVEPELFGRAVGADEIEAFRARHELGPARSSLYVGTAGAREGRRRAARRVAGRSAATRRS